MKLLVSIDPGMSTGIVIGTYSDTKPFKLTHTFQIEGGVEGFLDFFNPEYDDMWFLGGERFKIGARTILVEKFTARGGANAFAYRTDALEPLRVEGALLALRLNPVWQSPQQMYFMIPPGFKGNKKSIMHKWLKDNNLYVTGKDVGCKDADDARSAIIHALVYLRNIKHEPTLKQYFKE